MKRVLMLATVTTPFMLAASVFAAQILPDPPATTTRADVSFAWSLCLPGDADGFLCKGNSVLPCSNPGNTQAGPLFSSYSATATGTQRGELARYFDRGFDSRSRRMRNCLRATPSRPPRGYRLVAREWWNDDLAPPSGEPFFSAMQEMLPSPPSARQNAYGSYLYCVTHGGF